MPDVVSPEVRSRMMAGIRSANTKPELILRRELHRAGFRFTLSNRKIPGSPDIALPRWRAAIFANGCFWHGHDCHLFKMPATRRDFWEAKIARNRQRDRIVCEQLQQQGWRQAIVWECALKGRTRQTKTEVVSRCCQWIRSGERFLEIRGSAA